MRLDRSVPAGSCKAMRAIWDYLGARPRPWRTVALTGLVGAMISAGSMASDQKEGSGPKTAPPVTSRPRSSLAAISADGNVIAFQSTSTSILPGDTSGTQHIYAFDRGSNSLQRVSVNASGQPANKQSFGATISGDGRYIAFVSDATNLIPDDANASQDVFVYDRKTGEVTRVSVTSDGQEVNDDCREPVISADGRFVAFVSTATNFVKEDLNFSADVFVHELAARTTRRISVTSDGEEADHASGEPAISADGRYVAFTSHARNLAAADTNNAPDIYLHDVQTGRTELISRATNKVIGDRNSDLPSISGDGRFIAFESWASNLAPGDTNHAPDIFVRDRKEETTTCISTTPKGKIAGDDSRDPQITADGRYVAFSSFADDLIPGDTNDKPDIFLHDRRPGKTERISLSYKKEQANKRNVEPTVSADGRFVAFTSKASNLVPDDRNGGLDVFLVDRVKGEIRRISEPPSGSNAP